MHINDFIWKVLCHIFLANTYGINYLCHFLVELEKTVFKLTFYSYFWVTADIVLSKFLQTVGLYQIIHKLLVLYANLSNAMLKDK